ncbi:MAG: NUDIX domain-containing protein [Patescibacteria group bacterium]
MTKTKNQELASGVMIMRGDKVLLGRRHEDPEKADSELHGEATWTMPGGKVDFGERLDSAACRETEEETGLKIQSEMLEIISIKDEIIPDVHFITIGFLCHEIEGEAKVMEPDEIVEWQWFSLDNLPSPVYAPSLKIIESFQEKQIY